MLLPPTAGWIAPGGGTVATTAYRSFRPARQNETHADCLLRSVNPRGQTEQAFGRQRRRFLEIGAGSRPSAFHQQQTGGPLPAGASASGRQETVWSWRKNLKSSRSFSCGAYVCLRPKADIQQSKLNRRLSALCSHSERLSGVWKRTLVRLFADVRFRLNSQARPSTIARPRHLALDLTPPPLAGKQPRHLRVKRCGPAT
jgi:hypothetical protein